MTSKFEISCHLTNLEYVDNWHKKANFHRILPFLPNVGPKCIHDGVHTPENVPIFCRMHFLFCAPKPPALVCQKPSVHDQICCIFCRIQRSFVCRTVLLSFSAVVCLVICGKEIFWFIFRGSHLSRAGCCKFRPHYPGFFFSHPAVPPLQRRVNGSGFSSR